MNASEYQQQAARTLIDLDKMPLVSVLDLSIVWNSQGLVGEATELVSEYGQTDDAWGVLWNAGRINELCKKGIWHEQGLALDDVRINLILVMQHLHDCVGEAYIFSPGGKLTSRQIKEAGDVLWYVAALCTRLQIDMANLLPPSDYLEPIMAANIEKLKLRFPHGWDPAASAAKADEVGPC